MATTTTPIPGGVMKNGLSSLAAADEAASTCKGVECLTGFGVPSPEPSADGFAPWPWPWGDLHAASRDCLGRVGVPAAAAAAAAVAALAAAVF